MAERQSELRVRRALGASKARLVQQLITEGMLLGLSGSIAGPGIAKWSADLAAKAQPAALSIQEYTILDWRVISFALGAGVLTGLSFGVLPALLKRQKETSGRESSANRTRALLIAMQIAFALVLLTGSAAMERGFLELLDVHLGYGTKHLVTMSVSLAGTREDADSRRFAFYQQALNRLRAIPGVESAGGASFLPLVANTFQASGFHLETGIDVPQVITSTVTGDYFAAMGTNILFGREFNQFDRKSADRVVIVNAEVARAAGGGRALIGRTLISDWNKKRFTIVGVSGTMRYTPAGRAAGI